MHADANDNIAAIRSNNSVENYPCLPPLLSKDTNVLEVGCGAGWLSNCVSYHYGANVTAIDCNEKVIAYSQKVADALGLDARFLTADLFTYSPSNPYDLVLSLGVFHHTGSCELAIQRICRDYVKPGGHF